MNFSEMKRRLIYTVFSLLLSAGFATAAGPAHLTECASDPTKNDRLCETKSNGHGAECMPKSTCGGLFNKSCDCYKTIPKK